MWAAVGLAALAVAALAVFCIVRFAEVVAGDNDDFDRWRGE